MDAPLIPDILVAHSVLEMAGIMASWSVVGRLSIITKYKLDDDVDRRQTV